MKIKLIIKGRPMSKDNEKLFGSHGRPYTSAKYKAYAYNVACQAKQQMLENGWKMYEVPVIVTMTFFFKNDVRLDLFNAPKSIADALNGVLWGDDRQICVGHLHISYSTNERVEIEVEDY